MLIDISLSDGSVWSAIKELREAQEKLNNRTTQAVMILVKEGTDIARAAYGNMQLVIGRIPKPAVGFIETRGDANLIAEFGAGDATLPPLGMFENAPDTPVYPGSYSESAEGSGEYAKTGVWHFGGREYTQIEPRMGLYYAKEHIEQNMERVMSEVIEL